MNLLVSPGTRMDAEIRGVPEGGFCQGMESADQFRQHVDRGPYVVPLALTVGIVHVGAGVSDE